VERIERKDAHGFLFALPKLTGEGEEKARVISDHDSRFHYLDAEAIVQSLIKRKLVRPVDSVLSSRLLFSDPGLLITVDGLYSCVKLIDSESRRAVRVIAWSKSPDAIVPQSVLDLLAQSDYAIELPVEDVRTFVKSDNAVEPRSDTSAPVIVTVRGSSSDFEYQFPASPKFFVGRRAIVDELREVIDNRKGLFVLNAQSGWGKSSLALKFKALVEEAGGFGIVIDSRTASSPNFVTEAIRFAAQGAAEAGLLTLPADSSWASITSALATIEGSTWTGSGPLTIFFDQFENVFIDESTTRQFRDLALSVHETSSPLLVGFAWKTDLVGWTESHPYRLRDEIRSVSKQIIVNQMGAKDVEALLRRLEKRLQQRIARDLRQRLREYSQGLPWLFKKLSEHVIREVEQHGNSQEQLVNEALNVQSLFEADLAGLQPIEQDAVRHVARYAPVSTAEVTERYDGAIIQSLLDRRLLVPVGEKLDTYWDIFRDFLNTGQIPIEESYTLGTNPQSAAAVLSYTVATGSGAPFQGIASAIGSSVGNVINVTRTLRLLGIATYEAYGVHISESILAADDRESTLRRVVAASLKRHKAYSLFVKLAERNGEQIAFSSYAAELPQAFPAIDAKPSTWSVYGRAFALWFQYAGLAIFDRNVLLLPTDKFDGAGNLLSGSDFPRILRGPAGRKAVLQGSPGAPIRLFKRVLDQSSISYGDLSRADQRSARNLLITGMLTEDADGTLKPTAASIEEGEMSKKALYEGLAKVLGGAECLELLKDNPRADVLSIGSIIKRALDAPWKEATVAKAGKDFRSWVRQAGVDLPWAEPTEGGGIEHLDSVDAPE
jgi:hypothetical protein